MGSMWGLHGSHIVKTIWVLHGTYMGALIWEPHGVYMGPIKETFGGHVWDFHGVCGIHDDLNVHVYCHDLHVSICLQCSP